MMISILLAAALAAHPQAPLESPAQIEAATAVAARWVAAHPAVGTAGIVTANSHSPQRLVLRRASGWTAVGLAAVAGVLAATATGIAFDAASHEVDGSLSQLQYVQASERRNEQVNTANALLLSGAISAALSVTATALWGSTYLPGTVFGLD